MPTVILLDVSLSMTQTLTSSADGSGAATTRRQLAEVGLSALCDFVAAHDKLEFTTLVVFSSLWEIVVPFTRDYGELKKALYSVEIFDRTNLQGGLEGVRNVVVEEWGVGRTCQIILVTDGSPGVGPGSLKHIAQTLSNPKPDDPAFPLPFEFPNNLNIVLLASQAELEHWGSLAMYQKLLDANKQKGQIYTVEGPLTAKSTQLMFSKLSEEHYAAFQARLICGNLSSDVQLFPPPQTLNIVRDFEEATEKVSSELTICGFFDCGDVSSPPVISRHLVLPLPGRSKQNASDEKNSSTAGDGGDSTDKEEKDVPVGPVPSEVGSTPSFCVLLHGSLKVEGLVALVNVADNWYGLLHSCADSKKKSNLMLSLFEPGDKAISWLGRFHLLGPCSAFASNPYGEDTKTTPFPIRLQEKRSYSQNPVVWIKPTDLQADIQKILRYARKLPEKTQVFYKELNRLRRAAISFGMSKLLQGMSMMLERECTILPWTAHPEAAMQLTHAAKMIASAIDKGYDYNIIPLSTNFATDS